MTFEYSFLSDTSPGSDDNILENAAEDDPRFLGTTSDEIQRMLQRRKHNREEKESNDWYEYTDVAVGWQEEEKAFSTRARNQFATLVEMREGRLDDIPADSIFIGINDKLNGPIGINGHQVWQSGQLRRVVNEWVGKNKPKKRVAMAFETGPGKLKNVQHVIHLYLPRDGWSKEMPGRRNLHLRHVLRRAFAAAIGSGTAGHILIQTDFASVRDDQGNAGMDPEDAAYDTMRFVNEFLEGDLGDRVGKVTFVVDHDPRNDPITSDIPAVLSRNAYAGWFL